MYLAINSTKTPARRGSAGKETANPPAVVSMIIDKGVRNEIKSRTLSNENTYNSSIATTAGRANAR